ncbi:hypothetical protein TREES_T100010414 [Tupaia chinensis]|uniref:Uncharacterized protein n=1 Tax=Tupaia chinensis TaxID=246437 RepID=L9LAU7_TUPCH|nr:hypothetical protein TREES_T100010414 [Tupaia chinensis]
MEKTGVLWHRRDRAEGAERGTGKSTSCQNCWSEDKGWSGTGMTVPPSGCQGEDANSQCCTSVLHQPTCSSSHSSAPAKLQICLSEVPTDQAPPGSAEPVPTRPGEPSLHGSECPSSEQRGQNT